MLLCAANLMLDLATPPSSQNSRYIFWWPRQAHSCRMAGGEDEATPGPTRPVSDLQKLLMEHRVKRLHCRKYMSRAQLRQFSALTRRRSCGIIRPATCVHHCRL